MTSVDDRVPVVVPTAAITGSNPIRHDVRVAGYGAYGCVFVITIGRRTLALKAQRIDASNLQRVAALRNETGVLMVMRRLLTDRVTPNVLYVQRITAGPTRDPDYDRFIADHADICPNIRESDDIDNPLFHYTLMEYANGGTLHDFLAQGVPLGTKMLRGLAFQLAWTLASAEQTVGFRHLDLHGKNILLHQYHGDTRQHTFRRQRGAFEQDDYWRLAGVDQFVKLADMGLSRTATVPEVQIYQEGFSGLIRILSPTAFFMDMMVQLQYTAERPDDADTLRDQLHRGFHSDMWAYGVLLVEMALSGWTMPNTDTTWTPETERLWYIGTHVSLESAQSLRDLKKLFRDRLLELYPGHALFDRRVRLVDNYINNLPGICLLNRALGNGLLPTDASIPGIANSVPYQLLNANRAILERIGDGIYDQAVRYIRERHGDVFIDLVSKLLSWGVDERVTMRSGVHGLFMNHALLHQFFDELKITSTTSAVAGYTWSYNASRPITQLPFRPPDTTMRTRVILYTPPSTIVGYSEMPVEPREVEIRAELNPQSRSSIFRKPVTAAATTCPTLKLFLDYSSLNSDVCALLDTLAKYL